MIIDDEMRAWLEDMRVRAFANPVDVRVLIDSILTPEGEAAHRKHMTEQSVVFKGDPVDWHVTFSIEIGQPAGTCRHMA
jgi:hypothetical protein